MQLASSMTNEVTGAGSSQDTATGIIRLQNAANSRIEHKVRLYLPVFQELWATLYELYAKNLQEESNVKVAGPSGPAETQRVDPGDFAPLVSVNIEASPTVENKEAQQQRYALLWQQVSADPRFNHEVIAKPMLRAWGIRNPSRAWVNPIQTQQNVMEAIQLFEATGYIEPAMQGDVHQLWVQMLGLYMQTPKFGMLPPEAQASMMGRMEQHNMYLQAIMGASGQASQQQSTEDGGGEVVPGQEAQTNAETGSRMSGALQQGGEAAAGMIDSGGF